MQFAPAWFRLKEEEAIVFVADSLRKPAVTLVGHHRSLFLA